MEYRLIRSSRKTLSIEITPEGTLLVRCPHAVTDGEVRRILEEKRGWIDAHLQRVRTRPQTPKLSRQELSDLAEQAARELPALVRHYAALAGVTYGRITIRSQRSRWGSCSSSGNLNFNCLLMLAPPEVRAYVVVHELCHRKEMNHSQAFWQEVEQLMPDYRLRKKWLKDNGGSLMARLPE